MKHEKIINIIRNREHSILLRLEEQNYSKKELNELSNDEESFPLLESIKYGYSSDFIFVPEILSKLDLNITNKHGTTALMELAKYGQNNEIKILLKVGADWRLKDNNGKLAIDYAKEYQDNVDDSTWVYFTLEHAEEIANLK